MDGVARDDDVLLQVIDRFEDQDLPYMVVGAFAVMAHGVPRTTADIDVVVNLPFDQREGVHEILVEIGTGPVDVREDPQWGRRLVVTLPAGLDLEVFFPPEHPWYQEEYDRRVLAPYKGRRIPFLSPENLVLRKLVNTRLRSKHDLDDAIGVVKVQGADLDATYLREHCGVHRVCGLLEDVLAEAGHPEAEGREAAG